MKGLGVGVATTGWEEGVCKMVAGASGDFSALYDTQAERSICFFVCCGARCGLIYLTFRAATELGRMYNRDIWLCRPYNNSNRS